MPRFRSSGLQNHETRIFCHLKPPRLWYLLEETNRASLFLFLSSKIKTIAKQLLKMLMNLLHFPNNLLEQVKRGVWVCVSAYIVLMRKLKTKGFSTTSASSMSQHSWDVSLSVYKILSHEGKGVLVYLLLIFTSYYWAYRTVPNTHLFSEQLK